ncbi:MAG: FecR domain-containing protein [Pseudomonadota bacterium]
MTQGEWQDVSEELRDQALYWHGRMADDASSPEDNEAFLAWLTSDPQHFDVFAMLERMETDLDTLAVEAKEPANENNPHERWQLLPAAAAAVVALVFAVTWLLPSSPTPPPSIVVASASSPQNVALEDGSSVRLAPGTTAAVQWDDANRQITDFRGLGYFSVEPDKDRPFTVELSSGTITVVGTEFEVLNRDGVMQVTVTEGVITFTGTADDEYRVEAGHRIQASATDGFEIMTFERDAYASWETGQLRFEHHSLYEIAKSVNRYFGQDVLVVAPQAAGRTFRGLLLLETPEQISTDLAAALDLVVERDGVAYSLR